MRKVREKSEKSQGISFQKSGTYPGRFQFFLFLGLLSPFLIPTCNLFIFNPRGSTQLRLVSPGIVLLDANATSLASFFEGLCASMAPSPVLWASVKKNVGGHLQKTSSLPPGEGGLRNPDVQLLFDSIVYSDAGGRGVYKSWFNRTSFVNGLLEG